MKKYLKKLIAVAILLAALTGCATDNRLNYDQPTGAVSDMSAYSDVKTGNFYDLTVGQVVQLMDDQKTTIVYFGEAGCAWCEELVPVLDSYADKYGYGINYVDYSLKDNQKDTDSMDTIMERCGNKIGVDETGEPIFYFPTIMYLQSGTVVGLHIGTVSGHNAREAKMTEKQLAQLNYLLDQEFAAITVPVQ
jgi:predicted bacteriocin transport accessory protein